jgi:uncharacterized protein (DUF2252 family)
MAKRAQQRDIHEATRDYESWLREQIPVSEGALKKKHEEMGKSALGFLRATFYRWTETWPQECPELQDAPVVLAIGDLHIENFGTWRDTEGRLAWGVNDFDEAAPLPYTNDLVRLAASAAVACREKRLRIEAREAAAALLEAYAAGLHEGGRAVVLAEQRHKLGNLIVKCLVDPNRFWTEKMDEDLRERPAVPPACRDLLAKSLPKGAQTQAVRARIAGLGSLGRPRFVALAEWEGSRIAREAKAFVPSAAFWAQGKNPPRPPEAHLARLLAGTIRSRDPFLAVSGGWVVRRLAPDSDKIQIETLGQARLEVELAALMGAELANVHLATPGAAPAIRKDLRQRGPKWLRKAARRMVERVDADHEAWLRG